MKRFHLVELAEQPWCPAVVRDAVTDYLEMAIRVGRAYEPALPILAPLLARAGDDRVVDLGAGGGGPWPELAARLADGGVPVRVTLTDRDPNVAAFDRAAKRTGGVVTGDQRRVDARAVPADLAGLRTMFSAFHHLAPDDARAVLRAAAESRRPIAIFEATRRDLKGILLTLLTPLLVLLLTPRIRPLRWSRLLLTYVIPIVPLVVLFDGVVSCLRTYDPGELRALANAAGGDGYAWESGEVGTGPIPVTYLVGTP